MANCKDCFNCKSKEGRVNCKKGWWGIKEYSLSMVMDNRILMLQKLPDKCSDYSPPEQMIFELHEKSQMNRRKIGRIIDAVKDKRKYWYYDEPPNVRNGYWEEWE